ncbi:MAG: endonuclease/exonuclease/phosphatase family protein [Marinilabiliaceae bacterium]|nr:endonuclease/exonuclease/phosphatase family protein [Marinilabiliaceae bacterium]
MKKYLNFLAIFALLVSIVKINGQECSGYWDEWDQVASGEETPSFFHPNVIIKRFRWDQWDDGHNNGNPNNPGSPGNPGQGNNGYNGYSVDLHLMTYNQWRGSARYGKHKDVINGSGARVVALQEQLGLKRFNRLKKKTGREGTFLVTDSCANGLCQYYGIAMLWKKSEIGISPTIYHRRVTLPQQDNYSNKAPYIIGEFSSYCVVCVHYPLVSENQVAMSDAILADPIIASRIEDERPIYIAGDFNCDYDNEAVKRFTRDNNFYVLNDKEFSYQNGKRIFEHATKKDGSMIDLILEYNPKYNKTVSWRGIPSSFSPGWLGPCVLCNNLICPFHVSDHFPYYVKLWFQYVY